MARLAGHLPKPSLRTFVFTNDKKQNISSGFYHLSKKKKKKKKVLETKLRNFSKWPQCRKICYNISKETKEKVWTPSTHIQSQCSLFPWLKQVFCLCALECEAAVLPRYEGLHYEQHPLPGQGERPSWAIAALHKAPHPGLLFLRGTTHLTSGAGAKWNLIRSKHECKSCTVNWGFKAYGQVCLADSWKLYLSSGQHWPERQLFSRRLTSFCQYYSFNYLKVSMTF